MAETELAPADYTRTGGDNSHIHMYSAADADAYADADCLVWIVE